MSYPKAGKGLVMGSVLTSGSLCLESASETNMGEITVPRETQRENVDQTGVPKISWDQLRISVTVQKNDKGKKGP